MALNDPQWGRRGNDGPPDLDELWKRFRQKLPGMGGGGRMGRDGGGGPGTRQFRGGALVLVALVFIVWLASGFYIVDASQRGVVLRFGKYAHTTQPGPQWHLPYPFESVEIVNLSQVRTVEVGYRNNLKNKVLKESLMLTDDENIIDLQFAVQYILRDPTEYLFNSRAPDESVMQAAETAMREIVGKSRMDFVLYEGREQIAANAQSLMQQILDRYKSGISISKVTMQQAQPPEQVQAAFDDAVKAGQDRERQISEGQAYANDVIPKARGTASRLMQEAEGYRQRVVANAEGEAERFRQVQVEYSRAPQVTRERLYLETMQNIYANATKIYVDQRGGNNLLLLPLDKILQMNATSAQSGADATAGANALDPSASSASTFDSRSRDAFRNRDREGRP
ncbi:MAG: FtsH protease activity modulator HflK [Burkholderiales bacterium]|nr:FtsH protease activity modulator HflK [Burkholderiales bacterium]